MSRSNRVDLPKVLFLGGILLFFAGSFLSNAFKGCTGSDPVSYAFSGTIQERVTEDATHYARQMHHDWQEIMVECQPDDSNRDGYVSCTVGNGHGATEAIQCRLTIVRGGSTAGTGYRRCSLAPNRAQTR